MKKLCICILGLLACGCSGQIPGYSEYGCNKAEGCNVAPQPVCCTCQKGCTVIRRIHYISHQTTTYTSSQPEIYDPNPLPPLKIYHNHKSRPHHFVPGYRPENQVYQYQYGTANPVRKDEVVKVIKEEKPVSQAKPNAPHKL